MEKASKQLGAIASAVSQRRGQGVLATALSAKPPQTENRSVFRTASQSRTEGPKHLLLQKNQSVASQEALARSSPKSSRRRVRSDSAAARCSTEPARERCGTEQSAEYPPIPDEAIEHQARRACSTGAWQEALHILVKGYGARLRRYCQHLLNNAEAAEDVYQTVLLQAFVDLPRCSGRASFRAWLFTIARHRCLDTLKSSRTQHRYVTTEEDLMTEAPDPRGTPEEVLLHEATCEALRMELQRLPARTRQALMSRYYEQCSYAEMAQYYEEQPATLRVRISRALAQLRRALELQEHLNPVLGVEH